MLATRSIKKDAKRTALDLLIRTCDLTTLEGADTPGKVQSLCAKAMRPDLYDASVPPVAAVCVYPSVVPIAAEALRGSPVHLASVGGAFPSGLGPIEERCDEIAWAVEQGADEIDIVINRSAFLSGRYDQVTEEIVRSKDACGTAHLKVILETGELGTYDNVRRASHLAIDAGADFIKTSTGKVGTNATLPVALCMLEAIRDSGERIGFKAAGGVRTAKQGWQYLVVAQETLGPDWLDPSLFRIGASSMLNDVLHQLHFLNTGRYDRPEHASID